MTAEEQDLRSVRAGTVKRRVAISLNAAVSLLLAVVLVGMVNYLSYRHYARWDWSRAKYYGLSDKTLSLLGSLTNPVQFVVFFNADQEVYEDVDNLLKEYEYASPMIHVERVDPDRDLARTEELMRRFKVEEPNVTVVESGGRSMYVTAKDIMQYDYSMLPMGQSPEKVAFKGEQAFSSAIQNVTQAKRPVVYFLQGHGERDVESFNRSAGYSTIAEELRRDNLDVRKLLLGEQQDVPADADALVIAGPTKRLAETELAIISRYLDQKGRLMVLVDPMTKTGLEGLLGDWGVLLADDVVVDATRTLTGRELFITKYDPHPITAPLKDITAVLYLPRSVEPAALPEEGGGTADKPHAMALASCTDLGWAETDLEENPMNYDADRDRPGPVSVAVAVEKGPVPGINVQIKPTRLVVFGDSDFVANGALTGGNADFFMSALNWLLEREELMAIAPKPVEQNRLIISGDELKGLFWIIVMVMPVIVAGLGGIVWLKRRS